MKLLVFAFVAGAGAYLVYQLSQDKMLFYIVIGASMAGVLFLLAGFAFALVLRYSRLPRETAPRPTSSYVIDQPVAYPSLPAPEPWDSGRTELLPQHFTDSFGRVE